MGRQAAWTWATLALAGCSAVTDFGAFSFGDASAGRDGGTRLDASPPRDGALDATGSDASMDGATGSDASMDGAGPSDADASARDGALDAADARPDGSVDGGGPPARDARADTGGECLCPDDGLTCTVERCVGGVCERPIQSEACVLGGVCRSAGDTISGGCYACDPTSSQEEWTVQPGWPCSDGKACTSSDVCENDGVCRGSLEPGYCLLDGACQPAGVLEGGCRICDPGVDPYAAPALPDGTACTASGPGICCRAGCFPIGSTANCGRCDNACGGSDRCCPVAGRLGCHHEADCDD